MTADGKDVLVATLEEEEYRNSYHRHVATENTSDELVVQAGELSATAASVPIVSAPTAAATVPPGALMPLKETHLIFQENQRGVSFDKVVWPVLDWCQPNYSDCPYLRMFHQQRNLMELLETISKQSGPENEVAVHVVTAEDEFNNNRQTENFHKIADACAGIGIQFTWEYDKTGIKHDRDITTDLGWKTVLSRDLRVFQRYELNEAFSFTNRLQQHRQCKEFSVTFMRLG